jgi:hypothetical protein
MAELRTRLAMAEERLTELKAMLEDMRRDRDAWHKRRRACYRHLRHPCHGGGGCAGTMIVWTEAEAIPGPRPPLTAARGSRSVGRFAFGDLLQDPALCLDADRNECE